MRDSATTIIEPRSGWIPLDLRELWDYRELLYFFVWRDVKVRYKQTILGAAWAVIQPVSTMVVFSLFFGRLAGIPSDGVPYPIFSFAALVPWTFFANAVTMSSNSLVGSSNLIKKVYFPRIVVPTASVMSGILDFLLAFLVLLLMMVSYGIIPTTRTLVLLPLIGLVIVCALGTGLWLSALNVQFRDVRHVVPFLVQLWLFVTPIAYPSSLVPGHLQPLLGLNPMAGVVEGFRWALLDTGQVPVPMIAVSVLMATVLLLSGVFFFRRMETTFSDVV